jgi:hypothetical protein
VNDNGIMCRAEAYTASLDSALGLVDRVLPGRIVGLQQNWWPEGHPRAVAEAWSACVETVGADRPFPAVERDGATPALAVCAALLKALSEKDQANG